MTESTKKQVSVLLKQAAEKAGSMQKWGNKFEISSATVSLIVNGKWSSISDKMWQRVAKAVGFTGREWVLAPTSNYKAIQTWCAMAQRDGITLCMAHDAGTGKTVALAAYAAKHADVVYVQCAVHWTMIIFLRNMYRAMGKDPSAMTGSELAEGIIQELRQRERPLVILDEVDKLRDPILMYFIELYNKLDGLCGFFLAGAPYLSQSWERKAKRDARGFREIHSRIGRKFMALNTVRRKDVEIICEHNGIINPDDVTLIWNAIEREPDLRRVKREVEKMRYEKEQLLSVVQ